MATSSKYRDFVSTYVYMSKCNSAPLAVVIDTSLFNIVGFSSDFLYFPKQLRTIWLNHSRTIESSSYNTWLPEWWQHLSSSPPVIHVPQEAHIITAPLIPSEWRAVLAQHRFPELI